MQALSASWQFGSQQRDISSLAALVCLIWEHATTFDDEVRFIWRPPMNRVKALFLFIRYAALATLITNVVFVVKYLSIIPVPEETCRAWFLFLTCTSCAVLAGVDIVVMLRVYVLWRRDRRVAVFLSALVLLQFTLVTKCTTATIRTVPFDGTCNVTYTPTEVIYFASSVVLSQTILLVMTIVKRRIAFGQSPIVSLVVRDGSWIYVLIVSMFCVTIPYSIFTRISKPHIIFIWPISLLSIAGCRMVFNMQKAADCMESDEVTGGTNTTDVTLTTIVDTEIDSFELYHHDQLEAR